MALRLPSLPMLDPRISGGKASPSSGGRWRPLPARPPRPNASPRFRRPPCGVSASCVVPRALVEEQKPSYVEDDARPSDEAPSSSAAKEVLVVGATGGVGQLVAASLLDRNVKSRLLLRDPEKAALLFGRQDEGNLKVLKGDTRNPGDLDPTMFEVRALTPWTLPEVQKF